MIKDKVFYQRVFRIMLPMMLQLLINFLVQMLDTVMVGALGDQAVSAVTLANQPYFIFNTLLFGFAGGGSVLISQYWGKRDIDHIKSVMSVMFQFVCIITIIYMAICYLFPFQLMNILSNDPELIIQGASYLKVVVFSYLLNALATCYFTALSAKENVRISTCVYAVSFVVNLVANYFFIFGSFGFPRLGIVGAALGTIVARATELGLAIYYAKVHEKDICFSIYDLKRFNHSIAKSFIKVGTLVTVDDLVWSLNITAQLAVIGHVKTEYVAAAGIANFAQQLALILVYGASRSSAITIGRMVGEGDIEYTKKAGKTFLAIAVLVGILASVVILLVRTPILLMYPNVSESTKAMAYQVMSMVAILVIVAGLENVTIVGVLRGAGDTKFAFLADAICMWLIGFPIGLCAAFIWKLPVHWIYFCLRCDVFIKIIVCTWRVFRGNYMKDVTLHRPS